MTQCGLYVILKMELRIKFAYPLDNRFNSSGHTHRALRRSRSWVCSSLVQLCRDLTYDTSLNKKSIFFRTIGKHPSYVYTRDGLYKDEPANRWHSSKKINFSTSLVLKRAKPQKCIFRFRNFFGNFEHIAAAYKPLYKK